MANKLNQDKFYEIAQKMLKNKHVYGAVLCVENTDSTISYIGGMGDIKENSRYFIASVTKLYITAIMLMLREDNKLSFNDKIVDYLDKHLHNGIHKLKNVDYTNTITIAHLLSNTSGLPDYFYYEQPKGQAASGLINGSDEPWPLEKAINRVKSLKPKFIPGQKNKVNYSDTNFQLLGAIIEKVTGKDIATALKEYIFDPLKLVDTYAFIDNGDTTPIPMYYNKHKINAPKYIASVTAEGGIVSTAREVMIFLKAFFNGVFFKKELLKLLQEKWNMILFPGQFYFGLGLEKLWTPKLLTSFKSVGDILGFWGQSGAFSFYNTK